MAARRGQRGSKSAARTPTSAQASASTTKAQTFVGPDGTIYVTFANIDALEGPTPRILFVKCPADEDCTIEESWSEPEIVTPLVRRADRAELRRLAVFEQLPAAERLPDERADFDLELHR